MVNMQLGSRVDILSSRSSDPISNPSLSTPQIIANTPIAGPGRSYIDLKWIQQFGKRY